MVIDYFVFFKKGAVKSSEVSVETITDDVALNKLGERVSVLETEVLRLKSATVSSKTMAPVTVISDNKVTPTKHINYLSINGTLSQVAYDWTDVPASQFYFNKADYPGLKEIHFESNMKLFNGNGMAFVRLFDVTHGVAVTNSQVQTAYQNDTVVVSVPIGFMDGRNLIKVQIKSLTADSTVFNSGRLVITSEY